MDHLGFVAGMCDELGIGDVLDRAMQHNPETRMVTVGNAVNAMVLNGLGLVHPHLYLVPRFFQNKPTQRLIAPGIAAQHLHDDTLGRALDRLYDDGVTALYSLRAATAAPRLGLAPMFAHRDRTSFQVDGRYNSAEEPDAEVIHLTRGDSRDHRPDLNQVMRDRMVEHQAGMPLLMQPLSGPSSDTQTFGEIVTEPMQPLHTTDGTTDLVADSARSSEDNLQKLATTGSQWSTRVPATLTEVQDALAHAIPETMEPLAESYRDHLLASTSGGVAPRWMLVYSAQRRPQAQRRVDTHWCTQRTAETKACQHLCRMACACTADAQHALTTCIRGFQATSRHARTIAPRPHDNKRGRPRPGAPPAQVVYQITGALTSSLAAHAALVAPERCFVLATNELDACR